MARSSLLRDVRVIYNEEQAPLGIIDLYTCLQCIVLSSPEIISNLDIYDYAVYSTDYTEDCNPLVGHGMFSWLRLGSETPGQEGDKSAKLVVGRVCSNILAFFSGGSKETLEIKLRLKPVSNCTQGQYLKSIQLYKNLASFLPADFDHPAWAAFVSQNANLSNLIQNTPQEHQKEPSQQKSVSNRTVSLSPALPLNDMVCDLPTTSAPSMNKYYTSSSPPSSLMSNLDSDGHTTYSSPLPPHELNMPTPSFAYPMAAKRNWTDVPGSPVSMSSPIRVNEKEPVRTLAKRSLSTSIRPPELDFKTKARGPRSKTNDQTSKENPSSATGEKCCYNCGSANTTIWRRVNVEGGEEKELLCNPCGLWYSTKKTMRPPVPERRRRGTKRPNEAYVGPSITELLTLNVRSSTTTTAGENMDLTVPAGGNQAGRYLLENQTWARKSTTESANGASINSDANKESPSLQDNNSGENKDSGSDKPASVKKAGRVTKTTKPRKAPRANNTGLVALAIAPGPSQQKPSSALLPKATPDKSQLSATENLAKQLEEYVENKENLPPGSVSAKSTPAVDSPVTIPVRGFVSANAPQKQTQKGAVNTSTAPTSDKTKTPEPAETSTSQDNSAASGHSIQSESNKPVQSKDASSPKADHLVEPSSPVMSAEQLNALLLTPQKGRKDASGGDDFGLFDVSNFSGSPSRWMAKFLSSGGKSHLDMEFDGSDEAFKAILMSPSKARNDLFDSLINHDLDIDPSASGSGSTGAGSTTPTTSTEFGKLVNESFLSTPSKLKGITANATKSKLSDSPAIIRNKRPTLPSSPPRVYGQDEPGTNPPTGSWSDAQSPDEDEAMTVKVSPDSIKE